MSDVAAGLRERAAELRAHPMFLFFGGESWPVVTELDEREAVLLDLLADAYEALRRSRATMRDEWDVDLSPLLARIERVAAGS